MTGEITQFGFQDSGGSTDAYDFRFTLTGGQLAGYFAGKDLGMTTTSELSTFTNDFNVDFLGGAKGEIGAIDKQAAQLSGHKYTDVTGNGLSSDDTPLSGVTINLYQDFGTVGQLDGADVPYGSDVTDVGGEYSFANLPPGNYLVQEIVPAGYQATTATTLAVALAAGDNVTSGFDFANFQKAKITGTKFTDITGNGFSSDDAGLGGTTINLYQGTSASGTFITSTVTASDGTYSFSNLAIGTYFVQETVPAGYVQTGGNAGYVVTIGPGGITTGGTSSGNNFDNFQKAKITGTKFTDTTGNSFSSDDTGLGGVTINLYQGSSASGTFITSTTTASDGTYSFNDLAPGTYFVQETVPSGYVQTGGSAGYVVVIGTGGITSGGTSSGNNFDNFKKAKITGTKFTDITGNSFSSDDTGLGGVTINLYQGSSASGSPIASTVTASDGTYCFNDLAPGTYFVQETVPTGYVQTGGNAGYVVTIGPGGVSSGGIASGKNFDNFKKASITGTKFTDITGNSFSSDDTGLGGVTINLYQGTSTSGTLLTSTVTASNGSYGFNDLAPGTYFVQETVPTGYAQTGGNAGYVVVVGVGGVMSGGTATGKNFDNFKKASITGTKFTDITGNGITSDDTVLGGITINLYQGTSTSGALVATTTTASNGTYSFSNVAPGTYFLQEVVPGGYVQTAGNTGYVVTVGPGGVGSGGTSSGNNFANFKKGSISGTKYLDITGNGITGDDTTMGGVTIQLFKDTTNDGVLTSADGPAIATTTTASNGTYSFTAIGPGRYFVQEIVPMGYQQTAPTSGIYTVVMTSGLVANGKNFANFNPLHDQTATIGFWGNNNGQALIKSFGNTSSGLTLANWLATTFPNLFGSNAPNFKINSTIGTNLTNRSNTDVANYFLSLFNVSGQKAYAQVLADALAVFTTTNSLNTGTTSRTLAQKYAFKLSNTGTGPILFAVPQADWAAFGITSAGTSVKTILQLLQITNSKTVAGKLHGGNVTLTTQVNEVFSAINERGDITA